MEIGTRLVCKFSRESIHFIRSQEKNLNLNVNFPRQKLWVCFQLIIKNTFILKESNTYLVVAYAEFPSYDRNNKSPIIKNICGDDFLKHYWKYFSKK